eukprot:4069609-Amphidinium_carterae.1
MIQRFLWGLRHVKLGGDSGVKRFIDCTSELPPVAMEDEGDEDRRTMHEASQELQAALPEPVALEETMTSLGIPSTGAEQPTVATERDEVQHKRHEPLEAGRERKERRLEGQVKQEVTRIEKQTRAREETAEEPPRQRPRVDQSSMAAEAEMETEVEAGQATSSGTQYTSHTEVSWFGLLPDAAYPEELQDIRAWMTKSNNVHGASAPGLRAEKGPVTVTKLPEKWRELFEKGSRIKEGTAVLPSMTPLSEAESIHVERTKAERIMPMRWLDSWKQTDEPREGNAALNLPTDLAAKSRIVVQGFSDPDFRSLETDAPTPELSELTAVLQAMASQRMEISIADVSAAFNQSTSGQRQEAVYGRVPRDGIPGLPPATKIVRLDKELYGLLPGPAAWRKTALSTLKRLEFVSHPLSPCVFCLFSADQKAVAGANNQSEYEPTFEGWIVILVDDFIFGGRTERYHHKVSELRRTFRFGKWQSLRQGSELRFGGRTIKQDGDYNVHVDVTHYVQKIPRIELTKERLKNKEATAGDQELQSYRRLLGALLWAARGALPQIIGDISMLTSRCNQLTIQDIVMANRILTKAQQLSRPLRLASIPYKDLLWMAWTDSSLANAEGLQSQASYVIGLGERENLLACRPGKVSVICYGSHRLQRVVASSTMAEALALSAGVSQLEYWMKWWLLAHHPWSMQEVSDMFQQVGNREIQIRSIDKRCNTRVPRGVIWTDNKGVHDCLNKEGFSKMEKRTTLELAVIQNTLVNCHMELRWLPHELNVADSLTKLNGHSESLQRLIVDGTVTFTRASDILQNRHEERQRLGYNSRPNRSGVQDLRHERENVRQEGNP